MKKIVIFLLCIALIFSLVSCDVSSFWSEILGTTTTTQPEYETVLFQELICKSEVSKITVRFGPMDDYFDRKVKNIDLFYKTVLENIKLTCNSSAIETQNADYEEFFNAWEKEHPGCDKIPYSITFYDNNNQDIGSLSVYINNTAMLYMRDKDSYTIYVTVEKNTISQDKIHNTWNLE